MSEFLRFIAYFDFLGFSQFIDNNSIENQQIGMLHNLRNIENSLSLGKRKNASRGVIADLSESTLN